MSDLTYLDGLRDALALARNGSTRYWHLAHDVESAYAYGRLDVAHQINAAVTAEIEEALRRTLAVETTVSQIESGVKIEDGVPLEGEPHHGA